MRRFHTHLPVHGLEVCAKTARSRQKNKEVLLPLRGPSACIRCCYQLRRS